MNENELMVEVEDQLGEINDEKKYIKICDEWEKLLNGLRSSELPIVTNKLNKFFSKNNIKIKLKNPREDSEGNLFWEK
jgi:hypothetical protein